MFQNKGFTMIEMLFVLSIIISITLLTIPYYFTHQNNSNFENVQKQVGMMIDQAKQESLISHQKIDLCFTKKEVYYLKDEQKISFQLPDKFYFDKIKEVYPENTVLYGLSKSVISIRQIILFWLIIKKR